MKPFYIELAGINDDKKFKIMNAVLTGNGISRIELAERFDVSTVTVSKVISAMTDNNLLNFRKQSLSKGRRTAILYPTSRLKNLVIELGKTKISANLCLFDKSVLLSYSLPINESLDYEDNLLNFYSELNTLTLSHLKRAIYTVSLVVESKTPNVDMSRIYAVFPKFKPDAVFEREKCTTDYFCRYHPNESVVLINITDVVRIDLIYKGTAVNSDKSCTVHTPESSNELLQYLTDTLSALFAVALPDRIAISSENLPIDRKFCNTLIGDLIRRARLPENHIPEVEYRQELPYSLVSALDKMSEQTVRTFSGI